MSVSQWNLVGHAAVQELERMGVFDKSIIGYHVSTYKDGADLVHPPLLKIGRDRLGSSFGLTWQKCLTCVHNRNTKPIELDTSGEGLWIHFFEGGSIYLDDPTRLSKIVAVDDQVILCILGKDRNLYMVYSVFFDNPLSGLAVDPSKVSF